MAEKSAFQLKSYLFSVYTLYKDSGSGHSPILYSTHTVGIVLLNVRILSSTSVLLTLTTMQLPNLALVETERIALQVVFIEPNAKDRPPEYKTSKNHYLALCGRLWSGADRSWKTGRC
jgi:hypothetical protein